MAEHPNVELLRTAYAAFGRGDVDALDDMFADDVLWHVPGRSPLAGDYEGKEEVFGFLLKLMELTEGTARLEPGKVLADDTYGMALVQSTATRDGRTHSSSVIHVFRIADGQVMEFWTYPGDPYTDDEFLSS